jgi:GTP-binding protein
MVFTSSRMAAYERWNLRVSTGRLNRWLTAMARHHPPPTVKGKPLNVKYATQVKTRPPTFAVFVNRPNDVPESYQRCAIFSCGATVVVTNTECGWMATGS